MAVIDEVGFHLDSEEAGYPPWARGRTVLPLGLGGDEQDNNCDDKGCEEEEEEEGQNDLNQLS